jgi:hypothetical protein
MAEHDQTLVEELTDFLYDDLDMGGASADRSVLLLAWLAEHRITAAS